MLDKARGVKLSRGQKRALETVVPEDNSSFKATAVSSADGAKILQNLETFAKKTENLSQRQKKSFIGDLANTLEAKNKGSRSKYAKFETNNGTVVVRLSDHNAKVSGFDHNNVDDGISIVISRKPNTGITNDGNAHIVEVFYPDKALRNADNDSYAAITRAIRQVLYSGEYKDPTGLAEREEVNAENIRMQRAETPVFVSNAALKNPMNTNRSNRTNNNDKFISPHKGGVRGGLPLKSCFYIAVEPHHATKNA